MKLKTQIVLSILFLSSFIKSFIYSSNLYDIVFIILVSVLYLSQEYIKEKSSKIDLETLTANIDLRLKLQDEELERIKNNTSKMALTAGIRR